ncbi:Pentatricopeptide repeat-containing protein [Mycena sanguinolenta]|uniref:Pentatricopeptide repeat-containing protein n=1 Tax=Mycena sanguinolenta TaxID=230812 RepID=A0A8H6YA88_9AGAR|nr:Pentatricopeptide repeat-containing protein [Mycena sanguinolenta]
MFRRLLNRTEQSHSLFSIREYTSTAPRRSKSSQGGLGTSSSRPRWSKDPEKSRGGDSSSPPRYVRRATAKSPSGASKTNTSDTRFRSRKYDPTREKSPTMRLLEPHVLSGRLKKLADQNQLDLAVAMLKNAPLAAQNTPVWNTLIWESMKAKRFKLAYDLFIDMKRRGFSPTTRTFQTMFSGYARIELWSAHTKQLENVRSLYKAYQRHIEVVKQTDPTSSELSIDPLPPYITILGNAGQYEEVFILFYSMEKEGPLAPNKFIFTAMFQALSTTRAGLTSAQYLKNATDAKVLWEQVLKASRQSGLEIDAFVVTAAVIALSKGRSPEQQLAFQLVREYFGLATSDESPVHGKMPLTTHGLAAALLLCNNSQKPAECLHFFQQLMKRPSASGGVDLIDRAHVEEVLKARIALAAPGFAQASVETLEWMLRQEKQRHGANAQRIRPGVNTYNLVLLACWRGLDWNSATKTFSLMTGYHCHDFMDGAVAASPRIDQRPKSQQVAPTVETMSCLLRTALDTENGANMRQCLRIVDHVHRTQKLWDQNKPITQSVKVAKHSSFHVVKLATAIIETVEAVAAGKNARKDEMKSWNRLHFEAKQLLEVNLDQGSARASEPTFRTQTADKERPTRRPLTKYEMAFSLNSG